MGYSLKVVRKEFGQLKQIWVESAHVWSQQSTQLTNEITLVTFLYHVHCRLHTRDDYTTDYSIRRK
jgi:hypothetical protein